MEVTIHVQANTDFCLDVSNTPTHSVMETCIDTQDVAHIPAAATFGGSGKAEVEPHGKCRHAETSWCQVLSLQDHRGQHLDFLQT